MLSCILGYPMKSGEKFFCVKLGTHTHLFFFFSFGSNNSIIKYYRFPITKTRADLMSNF